MYSETKGVVHCDVCGCTRGEFQKALKCQLVLACDFFLICCCSKSAVSVSIQWHGYCRWLDSSVSQGRNSHDGHGSDVTVCNGVLCDFLISKRGVLSLQSATLVHCVQVTVIPLSSVEWDGFLKIKSNKQPYMPISPQVYFFHEFYQVLPIQLVLRLHFLMLMDHRSSSRSLISSPYLPHHFIWPKGNNKSLIHYPLTEAAMRKYLITGNKLNFNHLIFLQGCTAH